eukprot:8172829-Pyramimonas_sp.AAC.1
MRSSSREPRPTPYQAVAGRPAQKGQDQNLGREARPGRNCGPTSSSQSGRRTGSRGSSGPEALPTLQRCLPAEEDGGPHRGLR